MNPEDALRYVPSTTIRKRYVGDRNALVGGRSFGTLQPSRGLVYLDGYLLSNFLGRFDAPRWNMVTPEALEKVDVLYGPFSAIHAGNSIGTTVVMTERTPRRAGVGRGPDRVTARASSQYGESEDFRGGQLSAYAGTRFDSGLWGALTYNHQDSTSQPMQYYAVVGERVGAFPGVAGAAIAGVRHPLRRRPQGASARGLRRQRGRHRPHDAGQPEAAAGVRDHADAGSQRPRGRLAQRHARTATETFLLDASGNEVWQGRVTDGVNAFSIPGSAFAPSLREELHRQLGATLRTRRSRGWNGAVIASDYRIAGRCRRGRRTGRIRWRRRAGRDRHAA